MGLFGKSESESLDEGTTAWMAARAAEREGRHADAADHYATYRRTEEEVRRGYEAESQDPQAAALIRRWSSRN